MTNNTKSGALFFDTIILGAGAAGMYCAAFAGRSGAKVLVIDHAKSPGEKIRISGGGRCNFTNLHTSPDNFLSANPHFCKSALKRHTQFDFIDLVDQHHIAWHEKTLGQLFCDTSAKDVIALLRREMDAVGAALWLQTSVAEIGHDGQSFVLQIDREGARQRLECRALVIATGGKSIPKMGASGFGYRVAAQFQHRVTQTRPALVPLTFADGTIERLRPLAGISEQARIECNGAQFEEAMLFTHRGLSGPAILQISSYWREGDALSVTLRPDLEMHAELKAARGVNGKRAVATALAEHLPKRLAESLVSESGLTGNLADQSDASLRALCERITNWNLLPTGSEGYRTAEVTLGGVDTGEIDSRSMMSKRVPNLYFIGEVVDVTGWLGGYNFQWAWSSGWAAGTYIADLERQ